MSDATTSGGARLFDRPYVLLTLTSLFWAGNLVLGRLVAGQVPPIALAFGRWVGAFLLLIGFAWPHMKPDWPQIRAHPFLLSLLSLTGVGLYNTLAYWGLQYTEALNVLLIQSTGPLLIGVWTALLFRDVMSRAQLGGVALSLLGVAAIVTRGDLAAIANVRLNVGDACVLVAMVLYALYSALLRLKPAMHWLSFLTSTVALGVIFLIPAVALEMASGRVIAFNAMTAGAIAYTAVFPAAVASIFYIRGVELIGANRAGPFFHLMPVFGAAMAILLLGERPQPYHAVGFALVIAGVVVAARSRTAPREEPGAPKPL
jgi:drug/metabolite transporter (DMT)-like permease